MEYPPGGQLHRRRCDRWVPGLWKWGGPLWQSEGRELSFKWTLERVSQLRKLPEEWEKFPAMAVEVELDLETTSAEDYLAFLMDEAVQTFNQKEERCWVWNPHIGLIWDLILHFSSLQVEVSAMTGPGEVTGHIVGHEGRPIYQGLVREGIVKMSSCSYFDLIREISA